MRLTIDGDSVLVNFRDWQEFNKYKDVVKSTPYRNYLPTSKNWSIPLFFSNDFLKKINKEDVDNFEEFSLKINELGDKHKREYEEAVNFMNEPLNLPFKLPYDLLPYQQRAINFLIKRKQVLLNLDMGLGKTIVSLIASLLVKDGKRILIIVPSSLKYQWKNEIEKWFGDKFKIVVIDGSWKDREKMYGESCDFLITSYELIRSKKDIDKIKDLLWQVLIVDEATRFKNKRTVTYKNMIKLKAEFKFVLTGSPVENYLSDIWSIMNFVRMGYLGRWEWFSNMYLEIIQIPLPNGYYFEKVVGYKNLEDLKEKLKYYWFRIKSSDVRNSLGRRELVYLVEMSPKQKETYNNMLDLAEFREGEESFLEFFTYLREASIDGRLINDDSDGSKIEEIIKILEESGIGKNGENGSGENVLIFCFFTKFNRLLVDRIKKEGYKVLDVSGKDVSGEKQRIMDEFNKSKDLILVSSEVLSYGANLQEKCRIIINVDLPLNPIKLENRIARVDRLGQNREVVVVYLLTKGSVEERIYKILKEKTELIDFLIGLENHDREIVKNKDFLNYLLRGK